MKTHLNVTVSDVFDLTHPDHERNLLATLLELGTRDPKEVFGANVEYDRIKFTDWTPDTCGCTHRFMWHRDHDGDNRVHYSHRIVKSCVRHAQHTDPDLHHAAILSENQNKNIKREELAKSLGVPTMEIQHEIAADGTLILKHVKV